MVLPKERYAYCLRLLPFLCPACLLIWLFLPDQHECKVARELMHRSILKFDSARLSVNNGITGWNLSRLTWSILRLQCLAVSSDTVGNTYTDRIQY